MDKIGSVVGVATLAFEAVNLYTQIYNHARITVADDIVASFAELQAERVLQIQSEILQLRSRRSSPQPVPGVQPLQAEDLLHTTLGEALHRYAQALRDYDTLSQEALQSNPFETSLSSSTVLRRLFKPPPIPYPDIAPYVRELSFRELGKRNRLQREQKDAFFERLLLGAFGGIMLIAPMLLMVLKYDRNTKLITTSVATAMFTLLLAVFARGMLGKDVLAIVAAYAAVLVVFVGTSITPSGA